MGKHRSMMEWQQLIEAQRQSNLSIPKFCRKNNFGLEAFYHACRRFKNYQSAQFAELKLSDGFGGKFGTIEFAEISLSFECSADGLRRVLGVVRLVGQQREILKENSLSNGVGGMQEYTAGRWSRIVADQEKSNLNAKEYCARENIRVEQFYKQKRMLKKFEKSDLFFEIDCLPVFEGTEDMVVNFDGIILRFRQITAQDFRKVLEVVRAVRLEFPVNHQPDEGRVNG